MKRFVGICWTRPVPWAGFTTIDPDIEVARGQSLTIRYQEALITRYVKDAKGELCHHIVLMELSPDRATSELADQLKLEIARFPRDIIFLRVDFSALHGWRKHLALEHALSKRRSIALYPDPIPLAGQPFRPEMHFADWSKASARHIGDKKSHQQVLLAALEPLKSLTWPEIALELNLRRLTTHNGRHWTSDNIRKFAKLHGITFERQKPG